MMIMTYSFSEKTKINLDNLVIADSSKKEIKKILHSVFAKGILKEPMHGVLLIGSARTLKEPRDIDILIIAGNSPRRHFEFYDCSESIKLELQYIGIGFLKQLIANYYWYTGNLAFELGKFAHAHDLCRYDPELGEFLNTIRSQLPKEIFAFMATFLVGECICLCKESAKPNSGFNDKYCFALVKYKLALLEYLSQGKLPDKKRFPFGGNEADFVCTKSFVNRTACELREVQSICVDIINNSMLFESAISQYGKHIIYYPENLIGLNMFGQLISSNTDMIVAPSIVGLEF